MLLQQEIISNSNNNNNIGKLELYFYFLSWIGGVFYSIYNVSLLSQDFRNLPSAELYGFAPGWNFIGYLKDYSDYEWSTWMIFSFQLLPWICFNFIGSRIIHAYWRNMLPYWYIINGILFLNVHFGHLATIIFLLQPCLFYLISELRNRLVLWIFSLALLMVIIFDQSTEWLGLSFDANYFLTLTLSWTHLKCLSFSHEKLLAKNGNITPFNAFMYILAYCLYLPNMFLGPLIIYNKFLPGLTEQFIPWNSKFFFSFIMNLIRYIFWFLFTELCLHFIYSNIITLYPEMVENLDAWSFYGLSYCMGQFFMLKYTVVYGLVSAVANAEQLDAPKPPKCIARIHLYSDMWKHFDQGLHQFLVRYIYIPYLTNHSTFKDKTLATLFCFGYVCIWHRAYYFVFVWSLLNFIGVVIEMMCKQISYSKQYQFVQKNLSPFNLRRFLALIATPLFIMSCLSNFYFFGGTDIGNIYVKRIIYGNFQVNIILFLFCYTCAQVSIQVKFWEHQKIQNKNRYI